MGSVDATTEAGTTKADLAQLGKRHKLEPKSKAAKKHDELKRKEARKLKKNDSNASSKSSGSAAPLLLGSNSRQKKIKAKGKAQAKNTVVSVHVVPTMSDHSSVSGFKLEHPAAAKDAKFMAGVDARLRDSRQSVEGVLRLNQLSKFKDDDFLSHIRKLSGVEAKVRDMGWTFAKKGIDEMLSLMRNLQQLIKGLKAYELNRQSNKVSFSSIDSNRLTVWMFGM